VMCGVIAAMITIFTLLLLMLVHHSLLCTGCHCTEGPGQLGLGCSRHQVP
jgi:hypothetical protein